MPQGLSEIVILKPTSVFLAFLAVQLPEKDLPDLKQLRTDNTAYVIAKKDDDNQTLDEIKKHFTTMFHHEIARWLGDKAHNEVETSFLDFLCCFQFELHSHLIVMEEHINRANQALVLKPTAKLLEWFKIEAQKDEDCHDVIEKVKLSHLVENATVLVKNFADIKQIKPFIQEYYKPIFETAMSRMPGEPSQWPAVNSIESFSRYFSVEIHTQLIHLPQ